MNCFYCGHDISGDSSYCSRCGKPVNPGVRTAKTEEISSLSCISFSPGEKFTKRYRILEEVGHGGMGKVFKADDLELGSVVALKMIHPELLKNSQMIKRFKKEILLARKITHENVVRIHDFGKEGEIQFISMEYIEGKNLKEWMEEQETPDIGQAVDFFRQICRGLQHAHKNGIIHRDLKPHNIMVDKNRKAVITDFGLAKTIESSDLSQAGSAIGTPEYISPEQALGDKITHRADIYSLGLIVYELITGTPPFHADSNYGFLHKHAYSKPKAPANLNRQISPFLEAIVLRCLKKKPSDRYGGTDDILLDLDDERIFTPTSLIQYWARRLPKYLGIAAAMVLFALGFHYMFLRPSVSADTMDGLNARKTVAVMYFENMTGDKNMDHWRKAFSELLISDMSQSRYINVVSGDRLYEILQDMNQVNAPSYSDGILGAIAEKTNATYVIRGSYARVRNRLRLKVDLEDVRNQKNLGSDQLTCRDGESYFDMVDRLTDRLKPRLQLTGTQIAGDINRTVGQITTSSPEALRLLIAAREMYQQSKYHDAVTLLEEAVKIDPDFAMAYKNLAIYYDYIGNIESSRENLRKSLNLVDRVSLRERLLIEGFSENVLNNSPEKAIEKFEKLLETYPDDIETRIILGAIYRNFEQWELMKDQFERIIRIDKKAPWAHYNLVLVLCVTGKYDEAEKLLLENPGAFHNEIMYLNFLSRISLCRHDKKMAGQGIEKSLEISPENRSALESRIKFHLIYGENQKADTAICQILQNKNSDAKATGHYLKSHQYLHQGKIRDCLSEIDRGIQFSREWRQKTDELAFNQLGAYTAMCFNMESRSLAYLRAASILTTEINRIKHEIRLLHLQGMVYLRFNHIRKAEEVLHRIHILKQRHNYRRIARAYHHLDALLKSKRGDYKRGIHAMKKSVSLLNFQFRDTYDNHALHLNTLGELYYREGEYQKSADIFKRITGLTTGRIHFGDIYAKSFYRLGKISQLEGRSKDAIHFYERFLEIWKDADPDIPELSDARKRIAQLKKP